MLKCSVPVKEEVIAVGNCILGVNCYVVRCEV